MSEEAGLITLTFALTKGEFIAAMRTHWSYSHRRFACLIAVLLGLVAFGYFFGPDPIGPVMLVGSIVVILYIVNLALIHPAKQFWETPTCRAEQTMQASAAGIVVIAAGATSSTPWTLFERVRENEQAFLLYCQKNMYIMVPKRAFLTPADEARFRALLPLGGGVSD